MLYAHIGGCDKKRVFEPFWDKSPILKKQMLSKDLNEGEIAKTNLLEDISKAEITKCNLLEDITTAEANKSVLDDAFKKLHEEYKNFKLFIEPKQHSKSQRAKNPTSNETARTTRYNRCIETKDMLEYIHGGSDGAIFGAWEYFSKNASKEQLENHMLEYKKGNFMKNLYGHFNESLRGETLKEAVASKFQLSLSRRKFNFLYKVKSQTYDPETEKWNRKSISYGDKKMNLHNLSISDGKVTNFVNSLDIGILHTIPGYCGVFRTVAALTSRIIDLHLKCAHLRRKLVWYNGFKNHFIFEFSDDGCPGIKKRKHVHRLTYMLEFWQTCEKPGLPLSDSHDNSEEKRRCCF